MQAKIPRRAVLGLIAAVTALQLPVSRRVLAAPADLSAAQRLTGLFNRIASAREIGRAYLAIAPDEADADRLVDLIGAGEPDFPARIAAARRNDLRASMRERQQADFAAGRTVRVNGWVLSRTEARLCGLACLT